MVDQADIQSYMWQSAKEIFETMIFLPIENTNGDDITQTSETSLICTITFTGPMQGFLSILCSPEGTEKIARSMLMVKPEIPIENADANDAFAEVTNMILGCIKSRLNDTVHDIKISIPMVTKGREITPLSPKGATRVDVNTKIDGTAMKLAVFYKSAN